MTSIHQILQTLRHDHEERLIGFIRGRYDQGGYVAFQLWEVAQGAAVSEDEACAILDALVAFKVLDHRVDAMCPSGQECELTEDEARGEVCPHCDQAFADFHHEGPIRRSIYETTVPASEDVRWMVLLHGMNTTGLWQQEFTWLMSQQWGYAIPIYIYKNGWQTVRVLIRRTQQNLKRQLVDRLSVLHDRMHQRRFGDKPDVVAHSFGTWLIANALRDHEEIRLRRLILVAGVVPPDFDWALLIDRGQVEEILCHYSPVDGPVRFAHTAIPDAGPSGRIGFNDRVNVVHRREDDFGHSDYFTDENLERMIGQIWGRFLTLPHQRLRSIANTGGDSPNWEPSIWPIRRGLIRR